MLLSCIADIQLVCTNVLIPSLLVGMDEQSHWWSAVLSVAVHWSALADDDDDAVLTDMSTLDRLYAVVDNTAKLSHHSELVQIDVTH